VDAGASGIFYAIVRLARQGALSREEYRAFGVPYDLQVLKAVTEAPFNMLHICGPEVYFDMVAAYPVQAINWAATEPGNPSLRAARGQTSLALVGGVDETYPLRNGGPGEVVAAARQQGLGVYYAPSMRNGRARSGADDRGNAILSTLPLSDLEAVELPLERQRRVVILATVRLGAAGPPMRLADVHLENRSGWLLPNQRATGIGRRDQMRALLRTVRLDGPTVLAGDLNTWAYGTAEPVVGDLVGSQRFTFTPLPEGEPTLVAFFGLYARQLDYVFFRLPDGWSGDSRRVASRYGSDHYPLLAWVRPAGMTVAVIEALELVQINHQDGEVVFATDSRRPPGLFLTSTINPFIPFASRSFTAAMN
jgi:endonuclease/exonuclease/phosphatase family metal-dependent hydrolase